MVIASNAILAATLLPARAPATAVGNETMQPMKTGLRIPKLPVVLCSAFVTTAVFGQTTFTWTGAADGTNFGTAGNWTPAGGPPSGVVQDTAQWDGLTTSNLVISCNNPAISSGFGTIGINLVLTANQTNSVQIISPVMFSQNLGLNNVTIAGPSGSLVFGDGSAKVLNIIGRPAGALHDWINNSTNPVVICPNVRWQAGGGAAYTLAFDGTGDWIVTNQLVNDNVPTSIGKLGPGTLFWGGPSIPLAQGNASIGSPVVIGEGPVILKSSGLLANQAIQNDGTLQYDAASQSQTLGGVISGSGLLQVNNGALMLAGTNTYTGGTAIASGTLQIGTNGTSGSLGTGNVTNNSSLVFNRSDSATFANLISGTGSVVQNGSGTLTLAGANTYTGSTTVSNGTLVVNSVGGKLNVNGGAIAPTVAGSVGTLSVASNMNITSGTVLASLNKALSPSNSTFTVAGSVNRTGGTLELLNFGPALVPGDKFAIFNKLVTGGAGMTIVSPGFTVNNNLAVDGSVTVSTVASRPTITHTVSGGQLTLSWPSIWTGLHLQSQTNSLAVGLSTNWVTMPGTDASNSYLTPLNTANATVFYRLTP